MEKLTVKTLQKLRAEHKEDMENRGVQDDTIHITIGMGTCGIAAGAKEALNMFLGEAYTRKMDNIVIRQTGCMGLCHAEPTVEVKMKSMPDTLYGRVDGEIAKKIISSHLLGGRLVSEYIFDYPAGDIYKE
ncbi:MAG: NAD(P)-dependent iron-only hydrogenase iron-sulfur protein [Spirochaeta sp. LUC14_002_19_P3]|nr:MAG: NAD(P)-dependent iron-only hydrogenase iron-sulfur protein [Spirochaeta sp. LUC14_002_19_P3]